TGVSSRIGTAPQRESPINVPGTGNVTAPPGYQPPQQVDSESRAAPRMAYIGLCGLLLSIYYEVPEFLCRYASVLVDIIPPNAVHMRNIILGATPRETSRLLYVLAERERERDAERERERMDEREREREREEGVMIRLLKICPEMVTAKSAHRDAPINTARLQQIGVLLPLENALSLLGQRGTDIEDPQVRETLSRSVEAMSQRLLLKGHFGIPQVNSVVSYLVGKASVQATWTCAAPGVRGDRERERRAEADVHSLLHTPAAVLLLTLCSALPVEGRHCLLSGLCNMLRYPYRLTLVAGILYSHICKASNILPTVSEHAIRVVLERAMSLRPQPWGILITLRDIAAMPRLVSLPCIKNNPSVCRFIDTVNM
ncbi:hypothetical protein KIPB_004193, partial [Kipferlia bialata]